MRLDPNGASRAGRTKYVPIYQGLSISSANMDLQASEKNKESRHKAYEDRRKKRLEEEKRARELKLDLKKRIRHNQSGQP